MKRDVNHRPWINFKELRARLNAEDVLRFYKVEVSRKGEQHQGVCPLPGHTGSKNWPSFSVNLERGIFQCFGCKAKGNILEFAALMEGVNLSDGDAFRSVAVRLQAEFFPDGASTRSKERPPSAPPEARQLPVATNTPLDFELKGLDWGHESLVGRGFTVETMRHFGVGFCSRGLLKGRVAIPLHDTDGGLTGYAGMAVDESTITEENPRYVFPGQREREGTLFDFDASRILYNAHSFPAPREDLAIVEWFPSVWWLHQNGFPRVVATMGRACSAEHAELIVSLVKPEGRVWVLPDGGSEELALAIFRLVASRRSIRWVKLDAGIQPIDLSARELKSYYMR